MRSSSAWILFAVVLVAAVFIATRPSAAKPDYTRRTSKDCGYCHVPPGYNLNDAGKYYRDHNHSLQGYKPPPAR